MLLCCLCHFLGVRRVRVALGLQASTCKWPAWRSSLSPHYSQASKLKQSEGSVALAKKNPRNVSAWW